MLSLSVLRRDATPDFLTSRLEMYLLTEQQADTAGFKLLDLKASGGTCVVYKAMHKISGAPVALKVLNPGGNPSRIQREASVLSTLQHSNIARFMATGEIGSMVYLATCWIEGMTLRQWMHDNAGQDQPLVEVDIVLSFTKSIASALAYVHGKGISHGDINPSNILISQSQEVKLVDFGIGRAACDQAVTATIELSGTPRYMAPELIAGKSPSPSSDQYALALVVFELLSGQWPYSDHQSSAANALHHHLYSQPDSICELRPCLPASMNQVFARALSKLPEQRFNKIEDFYQALVRASVPVENGPEKFTPFRPASRQRLALVSGVALAALIVTSGWWLHEDIRMPILAAVGTIGGTETSLLSSTENNDFRGNKNCNLYRNSGFDVELEQNFYRDNDYAELATRVNHPSAPGSPVLQVGDSDQYGQYGIILNISGGQQYSFSSNLMFKDYVHKAELSILWLDKFWQVIEGEGEKLTIRQLFDGLHYLNSKAPDNAHYAVPTLFKDASAGIMYADSVIFSPVGQACNERLEIAR